jgi:hypothetical protein
MLKKKPQKQKWRCAGELMDRLDLGKEWIDQNIPRWDAKRENKAKTNKNIPQNPRTVTQLEMVWKHIMGIPGGKENICKEL